MYTTSGVDESHSGVDRRSEGHDSSSFSQSHVRSTRMINPQDRDRLLGSWAALELSISLDLLNSTRVWSTVSTCLLQSRCGGIAAVSSFYLERPVSSIILSL